MDAEQALYLTQARSDLAAYDLLGPADPCHRIHYLQMATEKLAKAYFWRRGTPLLRRHDYFVRFLQPVSGRGDVGRAVGILPNANWQSAVAGVLPVALAVERMAPAEACDGPNAEYPWPHDAPTATPATFPFPLWHEIRSPRGRRLIHLVRQLAARFEQFA